MADTDLNRAAAQQAFAYLNQVRANPPGFTTSICRTNQECASALNGAGRRPTLLWNDILVRVAEAKAQDMANRNYLNHVTPDGFGINFQINQAGYLLPANWIDPPSQNFFESIYGAGQGSAADGVSVIQSLIVADADHRNHLLGLDAFHADSVDCGIGYARAPSNDNYSAYVSIIIAKHSF
jgi:hypothetical protein